MSISRRMAVAAGLLAIFVAGSAVANNEVEVRNCSKFDASINSYNYNDPVRMFPYMSVNIPARATGTARCESANACHLSIRINNSVAQLPIARHLVCVVATQDDSGRTLIEPDLPFCNC